VSKRTAKVVEPLTKILPKVQAVRRAGAASLDMAYVAAGRAEGYFEFGPKAWDLAAGILLVTESGGLVSDITGGAYVLEKSESIIAAGSAFHPILVSLIN
jgi:myo-inositol-1(or 4)-monophosphatase